MQLLFVFVRNPYMGWFKPWSAICRVQARVFRWDNLYLRVVSLKIFCFIYEYILSKIVLHYLTFLNSRSGALDAQLNCLSTFFRRLPTPFPFIFSSPTWFCQREFLMRQNVSLSEFKFSGLSLLNKHVFSSWYHLMWKSFFLSLFYDFVNWYILISFIRHYFKRLT